MVIVGFWATCLSTVIFEWFQLYLEGQFAFEFGSYHVNGIVWIVIFGVSISSVVVGIKKLLVDWKLKILKLLYDWEK